MQEIRDLEIWRAGKAVRYARPLFVNEILANIDIYQDHSDPRTSDKLQI
jgi:hypothetical protein